METSSVDMTLEVSEFSKEEAYFFFPTFGKQE